MGRSKLSFFLYCFVIVFSGSVAFAANKCVDLFNALNTRSAVSAVTKPKAEVVRNTLLLPTADEVSFAQNAKAIEKRMRGATAEQRKVIRVPEFEEFVSDVKNKLTEVKNTIPRQHFILHYKLGRLIAKAEKNLQSKSFIYSETILLAMEASNLFTTAIEVKEGKNPKVTSDESEDGVFASFLKGVGNYIQKRDMHDSIYNGDRFVIPTMRSLSLNDFLLVADVNIAYVGVVDQRITYDGRVNDTPRSFFYHDFQHISRGKTPEENQQLGRYLNKVMQIARTKPQNIRIAMGILLFYFTHEVNRITDENSLKSPHLEPYLKILVERRSRTTDMGDRPEVRKVMLDGHSLNEALQELRSL